MELAELIRGAKLFSDGSAALASALGALSEASPRTDFFAAVYRSHPALEIGLCSRVQAGKRVDLDGLQVAFAQSPTYFDRWAVESTQRNRWRSYTSIRESPALDRYWRTQHKYRVIRFRRIVLCQGSRPVAYVSASLREGEPWSRGELERIGASFRRVSRLIRVIASVFRDLSSSSSVADQLLSDAEGAVVLTSEGVPIVSSPRAHRWLEKDPELKRLVDNFGRGALGRVYRLRNFHVTTDALEGELGARWQVLRCGRVRELPGTKHSHLSVPASSKEIELAAWLAQGLTNREIAERMGYRPSTIKTMLERLYEKHQVRGRVQLVQRLSA